MSHMKPSRPMLRYHGGKWRLANWIVSKMPPHRIYCEPYGGAASVLLQKPRSYAEVYNDLDDEVVNVFRVMQAHPAKITRAICWTSYSRKEYELAHEPTNDPIERARRTIVRSFMGFGSNAINRNVKSGFRSNATRSHTTPAADWAGMPPNMRAIASRFRGVFIENRPAMQVIATHDQAETLFYVDPPYVHATRNPHVAGNKKGYAHEMSDEDHVELSRCLHDVSGMVILSGYHSPLYSNLYHDWHCEEREARADGAKPRLEVLWINPRARQALEEKNHLFAEVPA